MVRVPRIFKTVETYLSLINFLHQTHRFIHCSRETHMPSTDHSVAQHRRLVVHGLFLLSGVLGLLLPLWAHAEPSLDPQRAQHLIRMVRQDCGSCHGMQLTGGLGPALTPVALKDMPLESLVATIYFGRPGTPMPPWKAMVSESEARWIARQLQTGFP